MTHRDTTTPTGTEAGTGGETEAGGETGAGTGGAVETLELDAFARFFAEANTSCGPACDDPCPEHGAPPRPFAWQQEYLEQVARSGVWADLDIPTGLGKTSLIDIWVFLLAWQARRGGPRTVPLRLFFVVDRRLVVDQTHGHAQHLARRLAAAPPGSVLAKIAAALAGLSGGHPLEVVRMRGGVDWASRWLSSPAQPAVVTATVDQYGSRLLFRGYGVSARMRPIDAALCGVDALLAVDEAHIALPLLTTAADCAAYQSLTEEAGLAGRELKVVSLSATASPDPGRERFSLPSADRTHPVARPRLEAQRRVTLLDAGVPRKSAEAFAAAAEGCLDALLAAARRPVVGIVANTIAAARAAHQRLGQRQDIDLLLITGRTRAAERDLLLDGPLLRELLEGPDPHRERPLVVVATQTIEVGWDISFGAMFTEVPSADALIQRLGRVDRRGGYGHAPVIVARTHAAAKPEEEGRIPVYGAAAARTWEWLAGNTATVKPGDQALAGALGPGVGLEVNPTTLPGLLEGVDLAAMTAKRADIPAVHATLLASWARTSPEPVPDQDVHPFLHCLDTSVPDVQIIWRADLPSRGEAGKPVLPGPHARESVAIPAAHLRRLLTDDPSSVMLSDLEQQPDRETPVPGQRHQLTLPVMRWATDEDGTSFWQHITDPSEISPGGTYMLPSALGGHDAYGFTGRTGDATVPDLGDFPPGRTVAGTRIDAEVLASLTGVAAEEFAPAIAKATAQLTTSADDVPGPDDVIGDLLTKVADLTHRADGRFAPQLAERLESLLAVSAWAPETDRTGGAKGGAARRSRYLIDGERLLLHVPQRAGIAVAGIGDDADTTSHTRPVALKAHGTAVGARARVFAELLGLPEPLVNALALAGEAHDCGKAHPRFQVRLCGGDRLWAESLEEPLAKSGMDPADRAAFRRADRLADWPRLLRHEALSAAAVRQWLSARPAGAVGTDSELITHLVAAHHGWSRPLLPPESDPEPTDVACPMPDGSAVTVNSGVMGTDWDGHDRFTALNQRYGPWGLALLETVIRLADMACSEEGT
ncbi:type I-U CRISPR-associated helicase/endonuclease Cas3 [Streptomyces sp. XM4011]|uniref:type I-G CRISPR-associated helicase/endonuclease Cas3g n=1 Tax=Streptomyces sp. XM4011 TaxID=2929780 RepID=UPI001FF7AE3E|nr:type I-U CRISPR-associated helicase/endonuclease Cas3 [Streptomyces sp. XM4011]MCK1817233.1 type I-U CRISPR-associated helicase/endonuclease Cas3 [Streptomyces sp. XM4011]